MVETLRGAKEEQSSDSSAPRGLRLGMAWVLPSVDNQVLAGQGWEAEGCHTWPVLL